MPGYFLGAPINVALHWFILGQVFGLVVIFVEFFALQIKNQRKYLLVTSIGSVFWMLMFISVGAQVPIILAAAFAFIRPMVFWYILGKDTPGRKKGGKIFLYVALTIGLAGAIVGIINLENPATLPFNILMLSTALLFVIGQYLPSKHYLRAFGLMYAISVLLLNTPLDTFNPMGIAIEASKIISIFVFYILLVRKSLLKKQLLQIKALVNCEMNKIKGETSKEAILNIINNNQLERLVAKMVKLEIAIIDQDNLTSTDGCQNECKYLLEKIQTVSDVKEVLAKTIELKTDRLNAMPIPKSAKFKQTN